LILDEAEDLRRNRRKALKRLKHFPPAIMDELLEDRNSLTVKRLDELVKPDDRINYGVVQPGPEVEQGIPLVRVENVVDEDFSRPKLKHISPQIETQYSRSRLHGDEVLVACVGSIGAVALVSPDQHGFNIARAVARIPVDPLKAERIFVAEYLKRHETQAYFKAETRVVAQPTLNIKQLCETRLPVPPLSVQRIFATRVTEIDKLKSHHRAHLAKLDALFTSLQHRAFRGEL
jgi:type I restriction enzyme, S subunit